MVRKWMHNRDNQPPVRTQNTPHLLHRGRNIIHIHQHVVRNHKLEALVREGQFHRSGNDILIRRFRFSGSFDHRLHLIGSSHPIAAFLQFTRDAAFSATNLESRPLT
jgi:hypothetical protein